MVIERLPDILIAVCIDKRRTASPAKARYCRPLGMRPCQQDKAPEV